MLCKLSTLLFVMTFARAVIAKKPQEGPP